jgi:hypothetical protein
MRSNRRNRRNRQPWFRKGYKHKKKKKHIEKKPSCRHTRSGVLVIDLYPYINAFLREFDGTKKEFIEIIRLIIKEEIDITEDHEGDLEDIVNWYKDTIDYIRDGLGMEDIRYSPNYDADDFISRNNIVCVEDLCIICDEHVYQLIIGIHEGDEDVPW